MDRKSLGAFEISHRFNKGVGWVAPVAAVASVLLILGHAARDKPAAAVNAQAVDVPAAEAHPTGTRSVSAAVSTPPAAETSASIAGQQARVASTIEVIVGRNDTMDAIFRRMALAKADLAAMRNLPGVRQSLDFMKPGDAINVIHTAAGEIQELSRRVSETETLKVVREDTGFAAEMISSPVETRVRTASAVIDSSLFQAAEASAISDVVALKLAAVFAYDIDFALDIRADDHFTVEYQQIYKNGKYLHDGEVLAAEFYNTGKIYRAVRFTPDGGSASYFTPDGKPLRKAFLRAPVDFTRVSSVFQPNRLHPLLNLIRGHMGTDYAAPTGTPVHAAGEGRVAFEGRRGGYGNAIMLAHGSSVSTLYGHMSRFARNIHVGSHVNQGDVVGYVGMTGLATGPHLHYEYLMNGVHMNPQTVHLPGAEPLHADALAKFMGTVAPVLSSLMTPTPAVAPATVSGPLVASTPAVPASSDTQSTTSVN